MWKEIKVKSLTKFHKQGYYTNEKYDEEGNVYLLRGTDMQNPKIIIDKTPKINVTEKDLKDFGVQNGDVLIVRSGAIGRYGIVKDTTPLSIFGSYLINFRFDQDRILNEYFGYFYESYYSLKQLMSISQGGSNININAENIKELRIPLPTLREQSKIVDILSKWDKAIDLNIEVINMLNLQRKILLSNILESTKEYNWKNIDQICKITTGKLDANAMKDDGLYRFYTCAKDFYRIDRYAFDSEALLISGNGANVGYIHYYKGKFNAYQRTYVLQNFSENILYIKNYLEKYLSKRIYGEKNEGNTPYITLNTLAKMKIKLPSEKIQKEVSHLFINIDNQILLSKLKLEQLQVQKKGLMQQLLTGKIRVQF